jgi:periplasmic divalent cation tolerance protein
MTENMVAFVTCGSRDEARKISEALVGDRLAACVSVVPKVESCFRWEGAVQWEEEYLLIIKSSVERIDRVRERVIAEHSYDVPEFIAIQIDAGSEAYLEWVRDSVEPVN